MLIGCPLSLPALQTGAKGKPVNTLYIANKMKLKREMYFAILLDRSTAGPVMIGCSEVGRAARALRLCCISLRGLPIGILLCSVSRPL